MYSLQFVEFYVRIYTATLVEVTESVLTDSPAEVWCTVLL